MKSYTDKIRALAKDLLEKGRVENIIGFRDGTIPMATQPFFAKNPADTDALVFNSNCTMNLATFITDAGEKTGVIAKGCDSRNIVTHIVENKLNRDNIHIIGVPCKGMVDKRKIAALFEDDIIEFKEADETLSVKSASKSEVLNKTDYLKSNCAICMHRNPVIYDALAGELVEEQQLADPYSDVKKIESMSSDEKWEYFSTLTEDCIRCYACRNACPLCYCPTCFVDESGPQWVGKGQNFSDIQTFHYLRAYHCAGRCTDCGACEEACPMGIKVREFTRKLVKDVHELFGWEAGLDTGKRPPLDTYHPDDPDDFIK